MARYFKTIEELKVFLPVTDNFTVKSFDTRVEIAENNHLKKWIGKNLLDTLDAAYQLDPTPPLSTTFAALLPYVQKTLSYFTFFEYIPFAELIIDDAGITRKETDNYKTAYSKQILELTRNSAKTGYDTLEILLEFLEENESDYPTWVSSSGYTKNKDHFINSAIEFSEFYFLNFSRQTFNIITHVMDDVEIFHVLPLIGQDFFDELKTKIQAKTSFTAKETEALKYLKRAVANLTISNSIKHEKAKLTPQGIIANELDKDVGYSIEIQANDNAASMKITTTEEIGRKYLDRLFDFLQENLDDFPTYRDDETVNPIETETPGCNCGCTDSCDCQCKPCDNNGKFFLA